MSILKISKDENGKFKPAFKNYTPDEYRLIVKESVSDEVVTNHKQSKKNLWELIEDGSSKLKNEEIQYLL